MRLNEFQKILLSFLLMAMMAICAEAQINMGAKNISVGESVRLEAEGSNYYTVSGYWSVDGNACYISSRSNRSCTVTGINSGSATVNWTGAINGNFYEMYWTVIVDSSDSGSGSGSSYGSPDTGFSESWTSSGNYNISWYDKNKTEYHLSTAKELAGLAYLVNCGYSNFENKTIKLDDNIDLSGKNWTTIGDGQNCEFRGSFDGQGHTISGIYIVCQHEEQSCYGFWAVISGVVGYNPEVVYVKNTNFQGKVNIETNKSTQVHLATNWYGISMIGGVAGYAYNVHFENIKTDMDVICKRNHPNGYINLGGIVGAYQMYNSKEVAMRYCSHEGNLYADVWTNSGNSNPPRIGGLAGHAGISSWAGIIEYSENFSSEISCKQPSGTHSKSNDIKVGGIVGHGSPEIRYCRSIVDKIKIDNSSMNTVFFKVGGIATNNYMTVINNYSVIKVISINSVTMYNNSGYAAVGGILAEDADNKSVANYSNSDVTKNHPTALQERNGFDGTTTFTSEQMKTSTFLEELNLYSTLEGDGAVWTQEEGGYPYIAKLRETSGISNIKMDDMQSDKIYTLSGQRLTSPKKGLNIIGGKKVVVK